MTLEQLPPKGVKREQAILELGKEEANGELLFQLVNTEKGQMQNGCSKGFGAAGVCLCCPAVGQTGQGQMDGQQYHVGCLFRLCIGADCPSYSKDTLPAAGRGGHKATGYRTTELLFPFDVGESLA